MGSGSAVLEWTSHRKVWGLGFVGLESSTRVNVEGLNVLLASMLRIFSPSAHLRERPAAMQRSGTSVRRLDTMANVCGCPSCKADASALDPSAFTRSILSSSLRFWFRISAWGPGNLSALWALPFPLALPVLSALHHIHSRGIFCEAMNRRSSPFPGSLHLLAHPPFPAARKTRQKIQARATALVPSRVKFLTFLP